MNTTSLSMDRQRIQRSATKLFIYCFLSYACSYIGRKNFSACLPSMIAEGILTKSTGGYVTTAYMICYGAGQLISGLVGSKVKPRYMIGTGIMGAAICNLAMGFSSISALFPVIWAINGLFHSMLWAPIIRVFTDLLPEDRRERAGTNISVACSLGAVLAFLLPAGILRISHWRVVFFVSGGILLAAMLVWVIGNTCLRTYIRMMEEACAVQRRMNFEKAEAQAAATHKHVKHSLPALILASGLWVALFGLVCNGALRDAVESWAPTFLADQFRLEGSAAALISVIIPIISVTGTYFSNWIYIRFIRNELYTACVMFGIACACVLGLYAAREFSALLCALFMAVSVAAMWGANHMFLTVIPYHFASVGMSSAVTGFLNSVIYFATAVGSGIYGILAEQLGWRLLILVWLGVGLAGIVFCILGGKLWGRKKNASPEEMFL